MTTALGTSIIIPSGMCFARAVPRRVDLVHGPAEQAAHLAELLHAGHHRHHDAQVAVGARAQHRAEVRQEDVGPRQREAHRAQAERRVHLGRELEARRELVAPDVERAQRHRPRRDGLDHRSIELVLLVLGRHRAPVDVDELGPVEADPLGAVIEREDGLGRQLDVRLEADRLAVARDARLVARGEQAARERQVPGPAAARLLDRDLARVDDDLAAQAVDDERVARANDRRARRRPRRPPGSRARAP